MAYDVPTDVQGTDVIKAACKQARVDEDLVMVKFHIKGKETTHWVLTVNPKLFHALIGLKQLVVGWSRVKLAEHTRPTQCYNCSRYGHISSHCKNGETCLDCGKEKHQRNCNVKRCNNSVHVNQFYPPSQKASVDHLSLNTKCPTRLLEVGKLKRMIKYG